VFVDIPTRGYKSRSVSKSHPGLIARAEPIRQKVFDYLLGDPRLRDTLKGNRLKALKGLEIGDANNRFLSADLTAASDRIPHELALALWSGFK